MAIRMTGLVSGLDTETIISQLVEARTKQIDEVKKDQTLVKWKKEAWSTLNTKLMDFYKGSLSKLKSVGTYKSKKVTSNVEGKATFSASSGAVNGTHTLSINQLAKASYLTGAKISGNSYNKITYDAPVDASTAVSDLVKANGDASAFIGSSYDITYKGEDGNDVTNTITARLEDGQSTIADAISNMNDDLQAAGIKMTVSYNATSGGLQFANTSAVANPDTSEGAASYIDGTIYTLKGGDDISKKALGLTGDLSIESLAESDTNSTKSTSGVFYVKNVSEDPVAVSSSTKLQEMGIAEGTTFTVSINGKDTSYTVGKTTTLAGLAAEFSKMGVSANYDSVQGRFYVSSGTGLDNNFTITSSDANALTTLGLEGPGASKQEGQNAIVTYNGVEYEQASNTYSINGLEFTAQDVTYTEITDASGNVVRKDSPMSISVETDVDAVYNAVKKFVSDYNSLISGMNTSYNAARVKDYEPLTDDEKKDMSDEQIEKWEKVIKDSVLRRDDTISGLLSSMRTTLNKSATVTNSDGTTSTYGLSSLGITTGVYTEYGQLHILGDATDADYSEQEDKLRAAILSNPEAVMKTLTTLGGEMYTNFQKAMSKTELSSVLTFYENVGYDNEISDYDDKIKKMKEKLTAEEDRYYSQFASMESAMSKLNNQQSYISQLMGS